MVFYLCHKKQPVLCCNGRNKQISNGRGDDFIKNSGEFLWNSEHDVWMGWITPGVCTRYDLLLSSNLACLMYYSRWLFDRSWQPPTLLNSLSAAFASENILWTLSSSVRCTLCSSEHEAAARATLQCSSSYVVQVKPAVAKIQCILLFQHLSLYPLHFPLQLLRGTFVWLMSEDIAVPLFKSQISKLSSMTYVQRISIGPKGWYWHFIAFVLSAGQLSPSWALSDWDAQVLGENCSMLGESGTTLLVASPSTGICEVVSEG